MQKVYTPKQFDKTTTRTLFKNMICSTFFFTVALLVYPMIAWGNPANTLIIHDTSGTNQTNRPVSISRPFIKGEIPQCVLANIDGTPTLTQTNVKVRWDDGSIKHAIVSLVIPTLPAGGSVTIALSNQEACNGTGALTQTQMLDAAYNFQTKINLTKGTTKTVNARTMISKGHWRYWLKGPIVTAVIIEDRSLARTYDQDFGTATKNLHPIIEAWFYPKNHTVEVGATIENSWASSTVANSMADTTYSLSISSGNNEPVSEYVHGNFNHIGASRWHRRFWNGTSDPPSIQVDHNFPYLVETRAIPHYNTSLDLLDSIHDGLINTYSTEHSTLDGTDGDPQKIGNYKKAFNMAGGSPWIGLQKKWEILWLYSMATEDWDLVLGNADLIGRVPMFFREADSLAGQGNYFDQKWSATPNWATRPTKNGIGTIDTMGRPLSINARPSIGLLSLSGGEAADKINTGPITRDGFDGQDASHFTDACYTPYLFTGRYYYLECLQLEAAYHVAWDPSAYNVHWTRPGPVGTFNNTQVRGSAWALKTLAYASFISPDGEPEGAYFLDKLTDNLTEWEGMQNIPTTNATKQEVWNYGRNIRALSPSTLKGGAPSPLGNWRRESSIFLSANYTNATICNSATSPWMENFLVVTLGMVKQMDLADSDGLLKFFAKHRFNQLLNPEAHVGTPPGPYTLESYRECTWMKSTNSWPQTWTEWTSTFADANVSPNNPRNGWKTTAGADHSYLLIARSALSFLSTLTADGYDGQEAWNYFISVAPDNKPSMQSQSPKWSLTPFGSSGEVSPPKPKDTVPPSTPTNLSISN